jgi:hypothetical protein
MMQTSSQWFTGVHAGKGEGGEKGNLGSVLEIEDADKLIAQQGAHCTSTGWRVQTA